MSPAKILFVENDPKWQQAIKDIIVPPDFQLEMAYTYREAVTKLQDAYDLVITNLCLSGDSDYLGETLLRKLAQLHIPSIVLTGSSGPVIGLKERYKVGEVFVKGDMEHFNEGIFLARIYGIIGKSKLPSKGKPKGNESIKRKNNDKPDASSAVSSPKVIIKVSGDVAGNITVGNGNQAKSVLEEVWKKEVEAVDEAISKRTEYDSDGNSIHAGKYEYAVFVSYAWGNESEQTVDELEKAFAECGIRIVRDKKDLGYKGSIKEFEQRIGQGQCIILVISDKYLRSEHCMYELLEIAENQQFRKRVFPIVIADAHIYKAVDRLIYIEHWDNEIEQLNAAIKKVKVIANVKGIAKDLDKYTRIRANIDQLTDLLSDMNSLTPDIHAASGFSTLIKSIELELANVA